MGSLCESKNIPKIPDKNIKENQISKITDEDIMKMNKEYNNIKIDNRIYYDDIQAQEQKLSNFKEFLIELNYQLSDLKDQLHISVYKEKVVKNILTKEENAQILNNLDIISNNINEFENLIEKQKTFLQYLEYNFKTIQEKLYEIKGEHQSEMDSLNEHLKENEKIINNLKNNKLLYEQKRAEIEKNKKTLQEIMEEKLTQIKKRRTKVYENAIMKKYIQSSNNSLFLKGSMLLGIKNSDEVDKFLKTKFIFKGNEKDINLDGQAKLVMKNWYEICHIYDDYDIYDITYEIKAVGLPNNMVFNTYTHNFISYDYNINNEILLFEIDGIKQTNYEIDKYTLTFNINLRNLESNKIHIKYKETIKYEIKEEGKKIFRKLCRFKYYGLSTKLIGQKAKYILKNESNFEIINFDDEFLIKTNDNEYQWGGTVPEGGKKALVGMSKKEGKINFYEKHIIKSKDNSPIKDTEVEIPFSYFTGNNQIINFKYNSNQTEKINLNQKKKVVDIKYKNTNSNRVEFTFEGELINRCKDCWNIELTDEEIDSLIPPDYKTNKTLFNKIANDIIKEYDEKHKNDIITVPSVVKIGKWVKNNIEYDLTFTGKNKITATETLNSKKGVCHHITKLFNALMYSLGYQTIYVLGYAIKTNNVYGLYNSHAWSLVKIDNKWLPFDATWGIFSGKLPITHVFKQIDYKEKNIVSKYDKLKAEPIEIKGTIY